MTGRSIEYVSIDTLAGRLDCKPEEIEALVRSGQFPGPVQIGSLRRWDVERIRAFMADVGAELKASARPKRLAANGLPGPDSDPFLRALEDQ